MLYIIMKDILQVSEKVTAEEEAKLDAIGKLFGIERFTRKSKVLAHELREEDIPLKVIYSHICLDDRSVQNRAEAAGPKDQDLEHRYHLNSNLTILGISSLYLT